jgi:ABC-type dipeptide/oligopeptide/nickel transport system permease component
MIDRALTTRIAGSIGQLVLLLLFVVLTVFTLVHMAPGDPANLYLGLGATAEQVAAMSEQEIFAVCTQRIRDLDAKARAALGATARSRPAVSSPRGPV